MTELLELDDGIHYGIPEKEYFAHSALSSTELRWLLDSPSRFRYNKDHPREGSTAAFDLGSATHTLVLGTGWDVEELDFPDYRSKDARAARDEAYAAGKIPMLVKDLQTAYDMRDAVLNHPIAGALFTGGNPEVTCIATDPATGVQTRCRFDYLKPGVAVDLKTTSKSASTAGFARSVADYGYHIQDGHYEITYSNATGEQVQFVFAVVETEPPHHVGIHVLDRDFTEMGQKEVRHGLETYARCVETNTWPGIPEQITLIRPPMWKIYDFQDKYGDN